MAEKPGWPGWRRGLRLAVSLALVFWGAVAAGFTFAIGLRVPAALFALGALAGLVSVWYICLTWFHLGRLCAFREAIEARNAATLAVMATRTKLPHRGPWDIPA